MTTTAVGVVSAATPRDPVVQLNAAEQARAKGAVLGRHDFPSEWHYEPIALRGVAIDATCSGLNVDLSTLEIRGEAGSRGTRGNGSLSPEDVVTEAFVFATSTQAQKIQAQLPAAFMRRCIDAPGTPGRHGGHTDSISRLNLSAPGVRVQAYRVAGTFGRTKTYGDYLFLQKHKTWVTIFYDATGRLPALEQQLLAAEAAHMG